MTAQVTTAPPSWRAALVVNSNNIIRFGGLAFVALAGFAGAFSHMHDWTREALPQTANWLCWANAVISEILPTVSFLSWRDRVERERSTGMPLAVFLGSSLLSLTANITAAGVRLHGDKYLLAALPMLAVLVLFKMVLGDLEYAKKDRERIAAAAERQAEADRRRAEQAEELRAEQARKLEDQRAEQAAELARAEREQAAELERRRVEIEQAGITERAQLEAAERAEVRQAQLARERRELEARLIREAEAARVVAEATAERERAEAERIRVEAALKERTAAMLTVERRAPMSAPPANVRPMRQRRPRAETQAHVEATLAGLPAGMTRDEAVKVVAVAIGNTERYAREFIPPGWVGGSSAGGEATSAA
jgi:hypothetical protein